MASRKGARGPSRRPRPRPAPLPAGPPRLDPRALPGPETVLRRQLPNGIVVLARENFLSPSVVLAGSLGFGALYEPPEQAGLADLTSAALLRGTRRWSFNEIYDRLESAGASLGFGSARHSTSFQGKALAEDLGLLLDTLAEALRHPTFPAAQVERLRGEKLTALAIREQDTGARASLAFDELAYPGHPYARPDDGTLESVRALTAADLRAFHRRHAGPRGMIVVITGAVQAGRAVEAVAERLGDWRRPRQPAPPALPPVAAPDDLMRRYVALPGKSQCDLVLGAPGPGRLHPEYLPAALGNHVLGRFGLFGRIGDAVRETAGLAYYAYSSLGSGPGPDPWQVIAGVNPANVERAVELIRREIGRFVTRRITAEELAENQTHFVGRLPLQLETNEGVAGALLHVERYGLGLDYYQRYPERIQAITRDQVLEVARRFLHPDRLALAVAGPPLEDRP